MNLVSSNVKSPRQIAEEEIAKEQSKEAVAALKDVMRKLANARKIVANYERELADLQAQIDDGTFDIRR